MPLSFYFFISIVTLSPTFNPDSSYSLILNLKACESPKPISPLPGGPPNVFGKFFSILSGELKELPRFPNEDRG